MRSTNTKRIAENSELEVSADAALVPKIPPTGERDTQSSKTVESKSSSVTATPNDNHLLKPEQVAERLSVSIDWVRDHSSRKNPRIPVIRLGGGPGRKGLLRYRASEIEKFVSELERLSNFRARVQ